VCFVVTMLLESSLEAVAVLASPPTLASLQVALPEEWIFEALQAEGIATVRRRRMPAEQVVWLVVAMGLYRGLSITECVKHLDLSLPGVRPMARSSVSESRSRVKSDALSRLFGMTADRWGVDSAKKHAWCGLSVFGMDGTSLRIPDTPDNRAMFPGHPSRNGTLGSYPLIRCVALMVLRSNLLVGASFGPTQGPETHEIFHGAKLREMLPQHSLTVVDKAYFSAGFLLSFGKGRHWLTRCRTDLKATVLKRLGRDDDLVEMTVSKQARSKDPSLPERWVARRIRYQMKGFKPSYLLTSLQDNNVYCAHEIVKLYHERWQVELGYRDIKSTLLERQESIRSKTPEAVMQELWGILLAYNLVRFETERIACLLNVRPTRVSFIYALRQLRSCWHLISLDFPGTIPKRLTEASEAIADMILATQERKAYPRAVKIKMSNYPRKKPAIELGR
jgi:hypothetical protein